MHRVQEFRLKYGWEQNELAHRAGLSAKVIYNIESDVNHDCQRHTMIKISEAFNLPPSVIFFPIEEADKRKMLSAIISVCMNYVEEAQVYETLLALRNHRQALSRASQSDGARSQEPQPAAVVQLMVVPKS